VSKEGSGPKQWRLEPEQLAFSPFSASGWLLWWPSVQSLSPEPIPTVRASQIPMLSRSMQFFRSLLFQFHDWLCFLILQIVNHQILRRDHREEVVLPHKDQERVRVRETEEANQLISCYSYIPFWCLFLFSLNKCSSNMCFSVWLFCMFQSKVSLSLWLG
jgi:hypothetical protein